MPLLGRIACENNENIVLVASINSEKMSDLRVSYHNNFVCLTMYFSK